MTITVRDVDDQKDLEKFFSEELPTIGVRKDRNIFTSAYELTWPMPPQPTREGKFIRWREYSSIVVWSDRAISMLVKVGGSARVREAVLACRVQGQADRIIYDLQEILKAIEGPEEEEIDGTDEEAAG